MQWGLRRSEFGEERTRRVFALIPTKMDSGVIVWLEHYWILEEYNEWTSELFELPAIGWQTQARATLDEYAALGDSVS